MKVLNLYAGIGGNRKLWKDVEVDAVEINDIIANVYAKQYPNDNVIISDAHEYLLRHFKEYDFIWSSPPCPSHSMFRKQIAYEHKECVEPVYPDMKLYEEIFFLKYYFDGKWIVENVKSYYEPLIKPLKVDRHYFWSNFHIPEIKIKNKNIMRKTFSELNEAFGFDIDTNDLNNVNVDKRTVIRNCIEPELGKHIFDCAFKLKQEKLIN